MKGAACRSHRHVEAIVVSKHIPGAILAERMKGGVIWRAQISQDRGRLEVVGIVPASTTATVIEPLDEQELRELLGEGTELHDDSDVVAGADQQGMLPRGRIA